MRILASASRFAFVATHATTRTATVSTSISSLGRLAGTASNTLLSMNYNRGSGYHVTSSRLDMSSGSGGEFQLKNIGREEMEEIIDDYENGGREESGYVILDVREIPEISNTGKLSPNTLTFPLQRVMQVDAFTMDADDFEEIFGFEKPTPDETLVFSCAAGIRSVSAAQLAAMNGYGKLINYTGGANEWFNPMF